MSYETVTSEQFVSRIDDWIDKGGEFPKFSNYDVKTLREAQAVVRAVANGDVDWSEPPLSSPNIFAIASLLQTHNNEILKYFREHAAVPLRHHIDRNLKEKAPINLSPKERHSYEKNADGYLFALQALIRFGHPEDANLVIRSVRKKGYNSQYLWSSIFSHAVHSLPNPEHILDKLRAPLPDNFCQIAFLDFANTLSFGNRIEYHPFDTEEGFEVLTKLVDQTDQGYDSYVESTASALPFLSLERFEKISKLIENHQFEYMRAEVDWAKARRGCEEGIQFLNRNFQTVQYHTRAKKYYSSLDLKPPDLQTLDKKQFDALVSYSDWMSDEQDFCGYPLENIKIVDQINVIWPAQNISTPFWKVEYDTKDFFAEETDPDERIQGVSLVSPVGFSRFFNDEDKRYSFSSCVEFDERYKVFSDKWPDQEWCAQKLEELNPRIFEKGIPSIFEPLFNPK